MPDDTTPQQVPLRDVPIGTWVLHDGKVYEVLDKAASGVGEGVRRVRFYQGNRVTSLVGTKPRLLTDADIGKWVWATDPEDNTSVIAKVKQQLPDGSWFTHEGVWISPNWPVWIVQSAPLVGGEDIGGWAKPGEWETSHVKFGSESEPVECAMPDDHTLCDEIDRLRAENAAMRKAGNALERGLRKAVGRLAQTCIDPFMHATYRPLVDNWKAALTAPTEEASDE